MDRLTIAGLVIAVAVLGYLGYHVGIIGAQQDDMDGFSDSQTTATCQQIRDQVCLDGQPTESDYPDSCFTDGSHVLEDPYTCPG